MIGAAHSNKEVLTERCDWEAGNQPTCGSAPKERPRATRKFLAQRESGVQTGGGYHNQYSIKIGWEDGCEAEAHDGAAGW